MRLFQDVRAEGKGQEMGKRLIDADVLLASDIYYDHCKCLIPRYEVENAPTVDAVELPLKVGHIVYHQFARWERKVDIRPFQVTSMSISQNKKGEWKKSFRISWLDGDKTRDPWYDYSFDDVGKTVFFTREEAEKAWEAILAERRSDEVN